MAFIVNNPGLEAQNLAGEANAGAQQLSGQSRLTGGAGAGGGARGVRAGGSPFVNIQRYLMANRGDTSTGNLINKGIENDVRPEWQKGEALKQGVQDTSAQATAAQGQTNQIVSELGGAQYGVPATEPKIFNPNVMDSVRSAQNNVPQNVFQTPGQFADPTLTERAQAVGGFTTADNYSTGFNSGLQNLMSYYGARPTTMGEANLTAGLFGQDPNSAAIKEQGGKMFNQLKTSVEEAPLMQNRIQADRDRIAALAADVERAKSGQFGSEDEQDAFFSKYIDPKVIADYRRRQSVNNINNIVSNMVSGFQGDPALDKPTNPDDQKPGRSPDRENPREEPRPKKKPKGKKSESSFLNLSGLFNPGRGTTV